MQRNKGLSKNRFKIEISIKILGWSVKFNVRKKKDKKQWALEKYYSFAAVGLGKKIWRTAMADSPNSASIEKMC